VGQGGRTRRHVLVATIVHLLSQSPYDLLTPSVLLSLIDVRACDVRYDHINT
jgi:hypothetical protein